MIRQLRFMFIDGLGSREEKVFLRVFWFSAVANLILHIALTEAPSSDLVAVLQLVVTVIQLANVVWFGSALRFPGWIVGAFAILAFIPFGLWVSFVYYMSNTHRLALSRKSVDGDNVEQEGVAAAISQESESSIVFTGNKVLNEDTTENIEMPLEQARTLVVRAREYAQNSHRTLSTRIPRMLDVNISDWDFYVAIAAVVVAHKSLDSNMFDKELRERFYSTVREYMEDTLPGATKEIDGLAWYWVIREFGGTFEGNGELVGSWIVEKISKQGVDSDADSELAKIIGPRVVHAFSNWWESKTLGKEAEGL